MSDFLDILAQDAKTRVNSGYYRQLNSSKPIRISLKKAIQQCETTPIIAEVKGASPSKGTIRKSFGAEKVANAMLKGGAVGISVLTEPKHFNGSLDNIIKIREAVNLPILMKDIFVCSEQIDAAVKVGANVILLIQALFDREYCSEDVNEAIAEAHAKNLEVLLETHNLDEFKRAIRTNADLVGINNRNLGTLTIDLNVTKNVLSQSIYKNEYKVIVSESGINNSNDLCFLRDCGAQAFLIGSSVMSADDIEAKVREFVKS
jgi:indole-3-glycerol phosphate synthase